MVNYTTEYLIRNEKTIPWGKLSADKDDYFSLVEVRLFRKRINWNKYLPSHPYQLTDEILEIGSKYFTKETYQILAAFNLANSAFIVRHADKFDFVSVIENTDIDQDSLLNCLKYWKDIPNVYDLFKHAKHINLSSSIYNKIELYFKI